ncbi:MAG: hypothetical protein ACR2P1_25440, partial [Pseudomonadales bacterium]
TLELSAALRAQLSAQRIPVHDVLLPNSLGLAVIKALLHAPRHALYQVLILFSALRQEGNSAVTRIAAWLALDQQLAAAQATPVVFISLHGVLQELQLLKRQGDFDAILNYLRQPFAQQLPDILVILQDSSTAAENVQDILNQLHYQHANSSTLTMLFAHDDLNKNVTLHAQKIATAVAEQFVGRSA